MVKVYRKGLVSSNWTPVDSYHELCISTIRLCIENLVLNKILSCACGVVEKKFLFIKSAKLTYWLTYSESSLRNKQFGYLESQFLMHVRRHPEHTVIDHIGALVQDMLPKKLYQNPGKEIVHTILAKNVFQYWTYQTKGRWFWETLDLTISPSQEDEMVTASNKIAGPVIEERKQNEAFRNFSDYLYEYIDQKLNDKTDASD